MRTEQLSNGMIRYTYDNGEVWDVVYNPIWDIPVHYGTTPAVTHNAGWVMLDFNSPEFHGIEFTLADGSNKYVQANEEVKDDVNSFLGTTCTETFPRTIVAYDPQDPKVEINRKIIRNCYDYGSHMINYGWKDITDEEE